jgi:hypothetical protein
MDRMWGVERRGKEPNQTTARKPGVLYELFNTLWGRVMGGAAGGGGGR